MKTLLKALFLVLYGTASAFVSLGQGATTTNILNSSSAFVWDAPVFDHDVEYLGYDWFITFAGKPVVNGSITDPVITTLALNGAEMLAKMTNSGTYTIAIKTVANGPFGKASSSPVSLAFPFWSGPRPISNLRSTNTFTVTVQIASP